MPGESGLELGQDIVVIPSWDQKLETKEFRNEDRRKRSQSDALLDDLAGEYAFDWIPFPDGIDPMSLAELFNMDPTHQACCIIKARAVAAGGFHFEKVDKKGAKTPKELENIFDYAFPEGLLEWLYGLMLDYEAIGNCYFEVVRTVTGSKVKALPPAPAFTIRRVPPNHRTGCHYIQMYSGYQRFFREFETPKPTKIEGQKLVNEMIHIKKTVPTSFWYGLPEIMGALQAMYGAKRAMSYLVDMMESKGMPNYLLIFEGARNFILEQDRDTINRYLQQMLQQGGGKLLTIGTPPNSKAHVEKLTMNVPAGDLVSLIKECRDQIARVHQVPPRLLSVIERGSGLGGSEILGDLEQFKRLVLMPRQQMWENVLYRALIHPNKKLRSWRIKFHSMDLEDIRNQMMALTGYVRNGTMTVNEARARIGLEPQPGGDNPVFLSAGGNALPVSDLDQGGTTDELDTVQE